MSERKAFKIVVEATDWDAAWSATYTSHGRTTRFHIKETPESVERQVRARLERVRENKVLYREQHDRLERVLTTLAREKESSPALAVANAMLSLAEARTVLAASVIEVRPGQYLVFGLVS